MNAQSSEVKRCLSDYTVSFLNYLENEKHLSPHTVFHYGHDLSLFLRYLSQTIKCSMLEIQLENVQGEHIDGFFNYLVEERDNSLRSAKRRLSAIRSFYTYVWDKWPELRYTFASVAKALSIPNKNETLSKALSKEIVQSLLSASGANSTFPPRDYALLRILLGYDVQLSEVIDLELDDFDQKNGTLCLGRDTRRERGLPLSPETTQAMVTYLSNRPTTSDNSIFVHQLGTPITKGAVYHLFGRRLTANSLNDNCTTIHSLRHAYFTSLASEGFSPEEIEGVFGPQRIQTGTDDMNA